VLKFQVSTPMMLFVVLAQSVYFRCLSQIQTIVTVVCRCVSSHVCDRVRDQQAGQHARQEDQTGRDVYDRKTPLRTHITGFI